MGLIPGRFTNPRFVALMALGLILALGFFLRRHLVLFLVVTLVIAVMVLVFVLWRMMVELKTAKAGKGIQGDLDRQVEEEIQKSTFGQDVAVRNVKAEWDAAMSEFRKSPVGRRLGDRALAQLPMYFVIGPEGAGKSALIEESGLASVLRDAKGRPKAVRGVGGGRDFSWWFTEQAFLLDMSGRTLKRSQFDDTEDWVGFLKSLQKQRPERPINGVVLAVPVHEIAGGAKEKVDPLATALRERLRDLGHHLGMTFPVWIMFTHSDRIAGFAETFEGFSQDDSEQAWGATVPFAKSRDTAAETLFEAEYATLVAALGTLRTARVNTLADDAQRLRALAFPAQLECMRGDLQRFVQSVFQKGKGPAEGGLLRGFYFVCSRVGGETVDRVLGAAAAAAGLPARLEAPTPQVALRAWFSAQLWRKIVLRDALLAYASDWARKEAKRRRLILLGGVGLAYLLLTMLFVFVAVNVAEPIRRVQAAGRSLASLSEYEVARKALVPLEAMRAALVQLEHNRLHKSFAMHLGAYSGDRVIGSAHELYVRRAEKHLLQPLSQGLGDTLEKQIATPATPFASLFYQYQVYRLLADPNAAVEAEDAVVLGKVFVTMLRPELEHVPAAEVRTYTNMARQQAQYLADHNEPKARFGQFDRGLASRAIAKLQQRWDDWPSLYQDMIADANEAIPGLTVQQILREAKKKQQLFMDSPPLAGAHTRAGWETFVRPRLAIMKYVVQSENDPQLSRELGVKVRSLTSKLGQSYADDYVRAWVGFLSGLKGAAYGRNGREALQREATFDSEILAVMNRVLVETHLEGEPTEVRSVEQRFGLFWSWLTTPKKRALVARIKSSIPLLRSESDKTDHFIYQELLGKSYKAKDPETGELTGVYNSSYKIRVANSVLKYRPPRGVEVDANVTRAFNHTLLIMGAGPPPPPILGQPVKPPGVERTDDGDPVALRDDWAGKVVGTFGPLMGKYPFSAGAGDARSAEFGEYFKPGGGLDVVWKTHFEGRVDMDGRVIGNLVSGTTPEMCVWMAKAIAIQKSFTWSGPEPKLLFDVRDGDPLEPSGTLHSITWSVGETSLFYDMGEHEVHTLSWSSETAGKGSSVYADVNGRTVDGPKGDGEWGLFRVLDRATLSSLSGGRARATWKFGGVIMTVEISPKTTVHPFSRDFMRLGPPPPSGN